MRITLKMKKMKIKYNKYIPFEGFSAINVFGVIYAKHGTYISPTTIRHERIHTAQMKEMLYIFFYIWYGIEWFIRFLCTLDSHKAYKSMGFEKEAYSNQHKMVYIEDERKFWNWVKYI